MGRTIEQLIPDELRELLKATSKVDLSVKDFGHDMSDKLTKLINIYYRRTYRLKPDTDAIDVKTVQKAIFGLPNGIKGFTRQTADILCKYAYQAEKNWEDFLDENPRLRPLYEPPNEARKKKPTEEQTINSTESYQTANDELINYLKRKSKEFESVYVDIAKGETEIAINNIIPPKIRLWNVDQPPPWGEDEIRDNPEITIEKQLEGLNRIIIVSEAGSGKTTLSKYIFNLYATNFINENLIFPIYLDFGTEQSLSQALIRDIGGLKIPAGEIQNWLNKFTPLLICDGLDNLTDENSGILEEINRSSIFFQKCKVIITSRESKHTNFFTSKGYAKYKLDKPSFQDLPKLLIKDKESLKEFDRYSSSMWGEYQNYIGTNNLLHTFFILNFLKGNKRVQNQGEILKNILEHYFLENWELAKPGRNKELPETLGEILNPLALMALFGNYNFNFRDFGESTSWYRGLQVNTYSGFTYQCLCNLITLSIQGGKKPDYSSLVKFYRESGLLFLNSNGTYCFSNQIFERYFHARGMIEFFFLQKSRDLLPFPDALADKFIRSFCLRDNEAKAIVAKLVPEPSRVVRDLYKKRLWWWGLFNHSDTKSLLFACHIAWVRKGEMRPELIDSIREQLIYFLELVNVKSKPSLVRRMLRSLSVVEPERILIALVMLKEEAAFETIFEYFLLYYRELGSIDMLILCWEYFLLFPDNEKLIDYCSDVLIIENYINEVKYIRSKKLEYLHEFQPLAIIKFYIQALNNPNDFEDTIFNKHNGIEIYNLPYFKLWDYIKEKASSDHQYILLSIEFEELILRQALNSDNRLVVALCRELIKGSNNADTSFLVKLEALMQEAKDQNDLPKLLDILVLYDKTPGYNNDVYFFYQEYIISESKSKQ